MYNIYIIIYILVFITYINVIYLKIKAQNIWIWEEETVTKVTWNPVEEIKQW